MTERERLEKLRLEFTFAAQICHDVEANRLPYEEALTHLGAVAASTATTLMDAAMELKEKKR